MNAPLARAILNYHRNQPGALLSLIKQMGPVTAPAPKRIGGKVTAVVGDSIAVDGGKAFGVRTRARVGIGTGPGISQLRGLSGTVVVSLGANDDPGQVNQFRQRIRRALRLAPNARLVWSTVPNRPQFNRVLRQEAARSHGRLVVADTRRVRTADGVHPVNPRQWARAVRRNI